VTDLPPLVRVEGVSCTYGGAPVLRDVHLRVEAGRFAGIVGPSGAGKTTLLRVLAGTLPVAAGTVTRRPDLRVGYVPQVETVDWSFPVTVAECVLMAAPGRRPWPSRADRVAADEVLDRLGLGDLAGRHIRELSGGQQQRTFIARALLGRPDLLLMDEPTSGVDLGTRHDVLHLLSDLHHDGLAVVVTTHDLNGIAAHLPHIVCLNTVVVGEGAPTEVLTTDVLERTYGVRMEILEHLGIPVVLDRRSLGEHHHQHDQLGEHHHHEPTDVT
jgi:ABC-type Mn2+/Zn2+ transport system ATPase subunit